MSVPKVLVLSGYGLNCEDETQFAFVLAGAQASVVHVNDLVAAPGQLKNYQILAVPGGFSYGDDTGSGKAYAGKLKNHLREQLEKFASADKLIIGICNGFQILTHLGLLPGALTYNTQARYSDRWVDLKITGNSPWLSGIKSLMAPIAHGEGKFVADKKTLNELKKTKSIAAVYAKGEICKLQNLPANPNGSMLDIAAISAREGRILGIMPHPERAMFFTQLPHWTKLAEKYRRTPRQARGALSGSRMGNGKKLPEFGPGLQIFKNAARYFA